MEFQQIVQKRRSIRKFTDEELTPEQTQLLLRAALMAPTSHSTRAWRFVVVDNKDLLRQIAQCKKAGAEFVENAPLAIVVLMDTLATDVWVEDAAIAAVTMQYQATELGLGSCWVHRAKEEFEQPEWQELLHSLGLEGEYEGIGHCVIGWPEGDLPDPLPRREGRVFLIE